MDVSLFLTRTEEAKKINRFSGYIEFNRRLDKITGRIKNLYTAYLNNHTGQVPKPNEFKGIMDKDLKGQPLQEHKPIIAFFKEIQHTSRTGACIRIGGKLMETCCRGYLISKPACDRS